MKRIIDPVPNGGAPLHANRLVDVLGNEIYKVLAALPYGLSDPAGSGDTGIIISGCKITGSGPYDCSAGIVFIGGEFLEFPGFTGQTLPRYITPAAAVNIQKTFKDGTARNLIVQKDATHQSGVPGGQYITLSTTGWGGVLAGGRRLFPESSWTNLALINSWVAVANTPTPGWRINNHGKIELRGQLSLSAGSNPNFASNVLSRPPGYSAATIAYIPIVMPSSNTCQGIAIGPAGTMSFVGTVNTSSIFDLTAAAWFGI